MKFTKEEREKIRAAQREYMREYRKRPEVKKKAKEQRDAYWLRKAQEMSQSK